MGAVNTSPRVAPNTERSIVSGTTHASAAGIPRSIAYQKIPNADQMNAPETTPRSRVSGRPVSAPARIYKTRYRTTYKTL